MNQEEDLHHELLHEVVYEGGHEGPYSLCSSLLDDEVVDLHAG